MAVLSKILLQLLCGAPDPEHSEHKAKPLQELTNCNFFSPGSSQSSWPPLAVCQPVTRSRSVADTKKQRPQQHRRNRPTCTLAAARTFERTACYSSLPRSATFLQMYFFASLDFTDLLLPFLVTSKPLEAQAEHASFGHAVARVLQPVFLRRCFKNVAWGRCLNVASTVYPSGLRGWTQVPLVKTA